MTKEIKSVYMAMLYIKKNSDDIMLSISRILSMDFRYKYEVKS